MICPVEAITCTSSEKLLDFTKSALLPAKKSLSEAESFFVYLATDKTQIYPITARLACMTFCTRVQWVMPYCFPRVSTLNWDNEKDAVHSAALAVEGTWDSDSVPSQAKRRWTLPVPQSVSRQGCSCCVGQGWWALSLPSPPGTQQSLPLSRTGLHLAQPWACKG